GGRLELGSQNPTLQNLTGSGIVSSSTASSIISVGAGNFSGVMTDSGSGVLALKKIGTGTLTLSGTNTYSGSTTISAGTLQIGTCGTTGSVAGNITDDAALVFNRSDALTYGGVISGTGSVTQAGSGTLTLSGSNLYGGGTALNAGTLAVGNNAALGTGTL